MKLENYESVEEKLTLISQMMLEARKSMFELGFPSLVWGLSISFGTLLSFLAIAINSRVVLLIIWGLVFALASLLNAWYFFKRQFQEKKTTVLNRLFTDLWVFIALTAMLLWVSGFLISQFIPFDLILSLIGLAVGVGYWLSGTFTDLRVFKILSLVWVLGSLGVLVLPEPWSFALFGTWSFLFEAIPGLILYAKERKQSIQL